MGIRIVMSREGVGDEENIGANGKVGGDFLCIRKNYQRRLNLQREGIHIGWTVLKFLGSRSKDIVLGARKSTRLF